MDIRSMLNSGQMHAAARQARPDCVDGKGNVHATAERARFVDWLNKMQGIYGQDAASWPPIARAEYDARYVPSAG
jgi:hypothetical protein